MSASGKSLLGLWLYRSGEQEWAVKEGSPIHKPKDLIGNVNRIGQYLVFSLFSLNLLMKCFVQLAKFKNLKKFKFVYVV